jgi:hypothetical protein
LRVFKDYYPEIIVGEAVRSKASAFKVPIIQAHRKQTLTVPSILIPLGGRGWMRYRMLIYSNPKMASLKQEMASEFTGLSIASGGADWFQLCKHHMLLRY